MIYILCICLCQLFVIQYLFICALYSLLIVHLFCSLFDYLFCFHSHRFFAYLLFKREKNNSDPGSCSRYFDPVLPAQVPVVVPDLPSSSFRVNKHHTADSTDFVLVQERRTYYHHRHSGKEETNILQVDIAVEGRDSQYISRCLKKCIFHC